MTVGKRATLWCYELILDLDEVERRLADAEVPRGQGDDRHPGQLPRPLRRRPRQGRGARPPGGRGVRLRRDVPGLGPDLHAEGRRPGPRRAGGRRRERRTGSARTSGCWPTSARSRSRSRPSRSARRRWPTSGTRCGPSGCARSPGSPWPCPPPPARRRRPSGSSGRSTTARSGGWSCPQAFLAIDAVLNLYLNVVPGLVVHPEVIARHVARGAAVHGDREPADGRRPGRRRPPGPARADPDPLAWPPRRGSRRGRRQRPDRPARATTRRSRRSTSPPSWTRAGSSAGRPSRSTRSSRREVEPIRRRYPDRWHSGATSTSEVETRRRRSERAGPAERNDQAPRRKSVVVSTTQPRGEDLELSSDGG